MPIIGIPKFFRIYLLIDGWSNDHKPTFPNLSMNSPQNYLGSFPDMLSYQLRHNSKHTLEGLEFEFKASSYFDYQRGVAPYLNARRHFSD